MLKKKDEKEIGNIMSEIVDETIRLLKDDIYKIVLYGSYARGDFSIESDIDIMIVLNCGKEKISGYRKQISRIASRIGLKNDIEISLLLRDRNTFEQNGEVLPLYRNIRREGITLYG